MANSRIQKLKDDMRAARDAMKAQGQEALQEAFTEFFHANPSITAIAWRQYTDYFNDGETCTFSVHEMTPVITKETAEQLGVGDDAITDPDDACGDGDYFLRDANDGGKLRNVFREFVREINDEDLFLAVFGDHVKIVARPGAFKINEYHDHD